jgi:4-carboxymuconolactone decarboxylase
MTRLAKLCPDDLTTEQQALASSIAAGRGTDCAPLEGPFGIWLHSPAFGAEVERFGAYMRYRTSLAPRLSELAILVCARHWRADYEWAIHAPIALKADLGQAIVEAIRTGGRPHFDDQAEESVYALTRSLLETKRVSKEIYNSAEARLGSAGLVELVGLIGYYSLVAFTLNVFEVDLPDGVSPPFANIEAEGAGRCGAA